MYYSEYSFHMHIWNMTSWADGKDIRVVSGLANSAGEADVVPNDPFKDYDDLKDDDPIQAILRIGAYLLTGALGI